MPRWIAALLLAALLGGAIWYSLREPDEPARMAPLPPTAPPQPATKPEREYTDEERTPQEPSPPQVAPPHLKAISDNARPQIRALIRPCLAGLEDTYEISFRVKISQSENQTTLLAASPISEIPPTVMECMKTSLQGKSFPFEAPKLTLSMKDSFSVGEVTAVAP